MRWLARAAAVLLAWLAPAAFGAGEIPGGTKAEKANVTISGSIRNNLGQDICGLVIANGQFTFTCSPNGSYSLTVPLDANNQVTLFAFVEGHFPFRTTLGSSGGRYDIVVNSTQAPSEAPLDFDVIGGLQMTAGVSSSVALVRNIRGGSSPYHCQSDTFANGAPPIGTAVDLNCNLSGTPSSTITQARNFTFGVCVVDIGGHSKCKQVTVTVNPNTPAQGAGQCTGLLGGPRACQVCNTDADCGGNVCWHGPKPAPFCG